MILDTSYSQRILQAHYQSQHTKNFVFDFPMKVNLYIRLKRTKMFKHGKQNQN